MTWFKLGSVKKLERKVTRVKQLGTERYKWSQCWDEKRKFLLYQQKLNYILWTVQLLWLYCIPQVLENKWMMLPRIWTDQLSTAVPKRNQTPFEPSREESWRLSRGQISGLSCLLERTRVAASIALSPTSTYKEHSFQRGTWTLPVSFPFKPRPQLTTNWFIGVAHCWCCSKYTEMWQQKFSVS